MHMQGDRGRRAYAATGAKLSAIAVSIVLQARGHPGRSVSVPGCECTHTAFHVAPEIVRIPRASATSPCAARTERQRCHAPLGANDLPFLLPFCFPSPRTRMKSPLGEPPRSCCQATRLPGSGDLINGDSVMQVAIANKPDCRMDGQQTHACVQMHVGACTARQDAKCTHGRPA